MADPAGARRAELEAELHAALEARRELGPELEPQVIEGFVERIEKRLAERQPSAAARPARDRTHETAIAIISLGVAIPLLAIAGGTTGLPGVVAVCVALVLLNLVVRR